MGSRVAAEIEASQLRKEFGIDDRQFDLLSLVREFGIEVRYQQVSGGAEGLSLRLGGKDIILVDTRSGPESRQRFTLAHEFGHQLLGHSSACPAEAIHGRPADPHEEEANRFATSLLMPARLFRQDIRRVHPRFEEISPIADTYGVSLTATAIRYTELTDDHCALFCFRPSKPPWLVKSGRCKGWWLRLEPPPNSLIAGHLEGEETTVVTEIRAQAWIENYRLRSETAIREEVRRIGERTWLVLLSELPDPDDDPDFEEREAEEELEHRRRSFRRY
ncbi:MAG: ImmA/IrrE family metallo-endopeptidase [bacterium]|nr:ImmA/IrrE family metallo-endopeptidase [bacterium]